MTYLPARLVISVLLLLTVSACGFNSLYGDNSPLDDNPSVVAMLSEVEVGDVVQAPGNEPDRRLTQSVRNSLLDRLDATGPGIPRYRLDVIVDLVSEGVGFRRDEAVTRVDVRLNADYTLTELGTGNVIYADGARAFNAYDVVRSDFATLAAQEDSERRIIPEVADQIMTRLGLYFKNRDRREIPETGSLTDPAASAINDPGKQENPVKP